MMWLFRLGIGTFEGYISYTFWVFFLNLRIRKRWFPALVMGISIALLLGINSMQSSLVNMAASVGLCCLDCVILFQDRLPKRLFYGFLGWFVMVASEFLVTMLLSLNPGTRTIDVSMDMPEMMIVMISIKLLTLLFYRMICNHSVNGRKLFSASLAPYFYVFPAASLLIYMGIFYFRAASPDNEIWLGLLLGGCMVLLFANLILFVVYDRMILLLERTREYELMEVKGQLTSRHYAQIEEMNQRHAEILHSMTGQLKVLEHLAKKDQNREITRILSAMNQDIQDSSQQVYSNHPILNAILNEKRKEAEAARVDYQVEVEIGFWPPRRLEKDLITILCNLIDNAVEAASGCDRGYVRMLFYTNNDGKFRGIRIENNYSREPVLKKDGSFLTSKADPTPWNRCEARQTAGGEGGGDLSGPL